MRERSDLYPIRVGTVFNSSPRVGVGSDTVWLDRKSEQADVAKHLDSQGVHVLIDGPTGTGKTSLALTTLELKDIRYSKVSVTEHLTWPGLCAQAMYDSATLERTTNAQFTAGIEKGLPSLSLRLERQQKTASPREPVARATWAATITEHDIAELMLRDGVALMIDDVEFAQDEVISRVASLAKILTNEAAREPRAKLIIVGTGDVFRRIYEKKPALEGRLGEVSLGTFASQGDSWNFLRRGFEQLNKRHPGISSTPGESAQMKTIVAAVYDAADGLPKALNELGKEICLSAQHRDISARAVLDAAHEHAQRNWKRYKREFRTLLQRLKTNPIAADVITYLRREGMGRIHDCQDMHARLDPAVGAEQVEYALSDLVEVGFVTRTGLSRDVLFVNAPALAHTLGVVMQNTDDYFGAREFFEGQAGQMSLLFDDDHV